MNNSAATYQFSADWFSGNIPVFEKFLTPLKGTPCRLLEIGTFEGRAAVWLLNNIATHEEARVTCIDAFRQSSLAHNLSATGSGAKAEVHIGHSRMIIPQLADDYDFAYVDGSHASCDVLEDAVLTFRKVKTGGIIGFDDYKWNDPKFNQHGTPRPAVDAFLKCYSHKLTILHHAYQVWVRKQAD